MADPADVVEGPHQPRDPHPDGPAHQAGGYQHEQPLVGEAPPARLCPHDHQRRGHPGADQEAVQRRSVLVHELNLARPHAGQP